MNRYLRALILAVSLLVIGSAFAAVAAQDPNVTTSSEIVGDLVPGGEFTLEVTAAIKEGYHIGANHPDSLYPAVLTIEAPEGIQFAEPVYPRARRLALSFAPGQKLPVYDGNIVISVQGSVAGDASPGEVTLTAALESQACTDDQCLPPATSESSVTAIVAASDGSTQTSTKPASSPAAPAETKDDSLFQRLAGRSIVTQLLILYAVGLMLAFTPCVYPMIPVTVGYFSAQTGSKRTGRVVLLAAVYVLGLALTYSIMGAVAAATGGVFGAAMQKPPVLIGIALVLLALALSMFGLYDLRPPSFILNRSSGRSGTAGALFMGLIFGLVAIPCVGPAVVGLLAYAAHLGNPALGFMLFFAMALGIGTPLFFLAAFSAKLPTPGMWMVTVKKAAGFLLVGAAIYFVLPIIPAFIGKYLIPGVLLAAGIYFGFIDQVIRKGRGGAAVLRVLAYALVFVSVMLIWPRPQLGPAVSWEPYDPAAVESAAAEGRPVMLEFSADWCGVCREMERGPLRDPAVVSAADRFVRLRVDGTGPNLEPEIVDVHKMYSIVGYPTIILLDARGELAGRLTGYADAKALVETMNSVK